MDGLGNVTDDGTWSYSWEHGRQLAPMNKPGTSVSFTYNAEGRRIAKTVNGVTSKYYYVGEKLTAQEVGSDRVFYEYDSIGPRTIRVLGSTILEYYLIRNARDDVIGILDKDGMNA